MIWWSEIMVAVSRVCTNGGLRECLYICEVASKSGAWPNNCTHSDKNCIVRKRLSCHQLWVLCQATLEPHTRSDLD